LTRFLGSEPSRAASRKRYWFLLIGGVAVVIWFACLLLFWREPEDATRPFLEPTEIVLGLMVAAQGAAGLARGRSAGHLAVAVDARCLALRPLRLAHGRPCARVGGSSGGAWAVFVALVGVWEEARLYRLAQG
jgi:hypothetical protein